MGNKLSFLRHVIVSHRQELFLTLAAVWLSLSVVVWLSTIVPLGWLMALLLATAVLITLLIQATRLRTHQSLDLLRRQIETSSAFSQEITSYINFDALLQEIAELIRAQFQYDTICLLLVDENRTITNLTQVGNGRHATLKVGARLAEKTTMGTAVHERSVVCVNNGIPDKPGIQVQLLADMRSELALPLMIGQKFLGVLDIQSRDAAGFDADHMLVLQSLAAQTAVTIRNANLYTREIARRRLAETLYDIGLALSGTLDDRNKVLNLILERLVDIVPYDRASLLLEQQDELEIVAARGFPADSEPLQIRIALETADEDDIYLRIHRSKRPLVVPDIAQLPNWTHVENLPIAKSWLGIPLIHGEEVIGMLSLVRETEDAYSEEDVAPATTFAVQAALALENANLYREIARFNTQLEYEIQQRTEAVLQLARLDQAKSDFINIAAHELRTPLTAIKAYSQMMLDDQQIVENEIFSQMANGIYRATLRLHEIVNNLLDVARIENETLTLHAQPIDIYHLLQRIQKTMQKTVAERAQTMVVEDLSDLPEVTADLDALHTVFSHLLMNAVKYTPDGGRIVVSGQQLAAENGRPPSVEIIISDTGIGIDPAAKELIFTKFYQIGKAQYHSSGASKFKGGGPGLGLAIVRGIVEAHEGRVWAESPGQDEQTYPGSHFHVVLPIQQTNDNEL